MNKRCVALIVHMVVFMSACNPQPVSMPDVYSLTQPDTAQTPFSYTPTPFASNTSPAPPAIEVFDTPTYSPPLPPISTLEPDQAVPLIDMDMMDESRGWGIEESGHIVHTKDGGITWEDVTPPQGVYNEDGFFALDAQTAWATPYCLGFLFGGEDPHFCEGSITQTHVWSTHDGGITWLASLPVCVNEGCNDLISSGGDGSLLPESIRFIDPQHGWLVISRGSSMNQNRYNGFSTSDGGRNWDFLLSAWTNGIISGSIAALEPLDEKRLFLFTNQAHGAVDPHNDLEYSQSVDGGRTWRGDQDDFPIPAIHPSVDLSTPSPVADYPRCGTVESKAMPPLVLDLTQECSYFDQANQMTYYFIHLHSENGGKTWNYWQQTGDVAFIDAKTGWQMVSTGDHMHEIQRTLDGGLTWSVVKTVAWDGVLDFVDDRIGYALAYNQGVMAVMFTADGGSTWEIRSQGTLARAPCLIGTWDGCLR